MKRMRSGLVVAVVGGALLLGSCEARAQDAASVYKTKCAACHGVDGKGDTPAGKNTKVRSFGDPEVAKQSDDELAGIVEKGKNKMPGYGKSLKPDEIKAMVAYIRSLAK